MQSKASIGDLIKLVAGSWNYYWPGRLGIVIDIVNDNSGYFVIVTWLEYDRASISVRNGARIYEHEFDVVITRFNLFL